MKDFIAKYSHSIVVMFVNQIVISLFGSSLAMATISTENDILTILVSIGAVLFYLFLLYIMTWDIGAKDRVAVDIGKKEYKPLTGLIMSILANIPSFVLALTFVFAAVSSSDTLGAVVDIARIVMQGMYVGMMSVITVSGAQLHDVWWSYFIITLPSIFVCTVAYLLGHKNFKIFSVSSSKK